MKHMSLCKFKLPVINLYWSQRHQTQTNGNDNMLNKTMLIGNLGADPDLRYLPNGTATVAMSLATTRKWKDKNTGERREETEWHRVVLFGRLAEVAGEYLKKGSKIYIEGRLKTRKWQGQDKQDNYTTEIIGEELQMLSGRTLGNDTPQPFAAAPAPPPDDFDDDIPF